MGGTLLSKKATDAGGRPCGDATAEEVGVLRPDRTAEGKRGREDGPVFGIAYAQPLPRFGFEVAVDILTDNSRDHRPV